MKTLHLLPAILGATLLGGCVYEEEYYGYDRPRPVYRGGYVERDVVYERRPNYYYDDRPRGYYDDRPRYYGTTVVTVDPRYHNDWRDRDRHDNDDHKKRGDDDHDKKKKKKDSDDDRQSYSRFSNPPTPGAARNGPLPRYQTQSKPESHDHDGDKKKKKDDD